MLPDSGYFYAPYIPLYQSPVVGFTEPTNWAEEMLTQELAQGINNEIDADILADLRNNHGDAFIREHYPHLPIPLIRPHFEKYYEKIHISWVKEGF
jgi:hypothetical protein